MVNQKPGFPEDPTGMDTSAEGEDFAQLLEVELQNHYTPPSDGEVLDGHVLSVNEREVVIDFGYKSEGLIPIGEFLGPDGVLTIKPGDTIQVMVDRHAPPVDGYIMLSHKRAENREVWEALEKAFRESEVIQAKVTGVTKGGLNVDVGVPAFLPGSQIDSRPVHDLEQFVGQEIPVRVVKLNQRRGNVVVSRKAITEEAVNAQKAEALSRIQEGGIVTGVVKNLTEYGAFVDLGGIDGLLHVSDMSFGRVRHPSEVVQVGDTITARVLKFDAAKERISLGMKQAMRDPWEAASERYTQGAKAFGRVVSVTDYGAFVELEPGVEGLIHVSEMTWSRRMKHPAKVMKVGDEVEAVVLEVKISDHRISLGIKQLEADPWTTLEERYSVGSIVEGRVRKLTDFGVFLEIEEGVDGLIHVSDLSWTKRVKNPSEVMKKGQITQAVILAMDAANRRLSLGIKQLQPDAWESFFQGHLPGHVVRGKVLRSAGFGVFVELAPGVEGLCHMSEIPIPADHVGDAPVLPVGAEMDFKIIRLNEAEKKVALSLKAMADDQERARLDDYQRKAVATSMSIEEVMQWKEGEPDA
jgi:small subunit ribosomal protein S1